MAPHHVPYLPILVAFALVIGALTVMFLANWWLGPKRPSKTKQASFECGNPPMGDARRRFSVKYYTVAILFIVFDIEAVFLYPWGALFRDFLEKDGLGGLVLAEMFLFLGILLLGLVYVIRKGALGWAGPGRKEEVQ